MADTKKKVLILGAGRQGRSAAYDFLRKGNSYAITVADAMIEALEAAREQLSLEEGQTTQVDLQDEEAVRDLLRGADGAVFAADYALNERLTRWAIAEGCHAVDFGGNHDVVDRQHELHETAQQAGVAIVPDTGLTPGLAGILVAGGIGKLDEAHSAGIRVGGLPQEPKPPLDYSLLFSVRGLTNEYLEPSVVIEDGAVTTKPSMTGLELLDIEGREYEAFYTSGGVSTLPQTFGDKLKKLDCKTLRYPGHARLIRFAFDIGFRSEEVVSVKGRDIVPREVFEAMLEQSLPHDEPDITVMRVTVVGKKDGRITRAVYSMIDYFDEETGFTSMQRCTAWPGTIILHMLLDERLTQRGVLYQERAVNCDQMVESLQKRGIDIHLAMK